MYRMRGFRSVVPQVSRRCELPLASAMLLQRSPTSKSRNQTMCMQKLFQLTVIISGLLFIYFTASLVVSGKAPSMPVGSSNAVIPHRTCECAAAAP